MGVITKLIISTAILVIPLSMWLYYVFHNGIPDAFEHNLTHLNDHIVPEVLLNIQKYKKFPNTIKKTILIPIAYHNSDPIETSIAWQILTNEYNLDVKFATKNGFKAITDQVMLNRQGDGCFNRI